MGCSECNDLVPSAQHGTRTITVHHRKITKPSPSSGFQELDLEIGMGRIFQDPTISCYHYNLCGPLTSSIFWQCLLSDFFILLYLFLPCLGWKIFGTLLSTISWVFFFADSLSPVLSTFSMTSIFFPGILTSEGTGSKRMGALAEQKGFIQIVVFFFKAKLNMNANMNCAIWTQC